MLEYPPMVIPRDTVQTNSNIEVSLTTICNVDTYFTNILWPMTEGYVLGVIPKDLFEQAAEKFFIAFLGNVKE